MEYLKNETTVDGLKVIEDINEAVKVLENGETIAHWEWGESMMPILQSGQYVRLTPCYTTPDVGDIVLGYVNSHWTCHLALKVNKASGWCQIGTTNGEEIGWTKDILAIGKPMPYIQNPNVY